MKPSFDTRLLCRCSECDTVFRLAANQLATRAGLVRCGDCGTVFNAAWNLVDEIPNPVESSTPVAPILILSHNQGKTPLEATENSDGPGFAAHEHLFSLDDQLRQDLHLGTNDPRALEEIRRTLGPTDTTTQAVGRRTSSESPVMRVRRRNVAHGPHSEPQFSEPTPLETDVQSAANRHRLAGSSSPRGRARVKGLLLLATFVAAVGLFMQTRYWLFDELSVIPAARAPLESFCRLVDCTVPPPLMGPAFRVLETRVDLDPHLPGAVIVKIHLTNRTTTSLPYPAIQLTLTDREGRTIGKRTYTTGDYSTTTDTGELPPGLVEVVILHLAGPDENAVGFEASIIKTGM